MAHANPEFGIAQRAWKAPPERCATRPAASLGEMRARMIEIGERIRTEATVSAAEERAYRIWCATVRQQRSDEAFGRQLDAAIHPGKGMHGGDPARVRFVEPVRRGEGRCARFAAR